MEQPPKALNNTRRRNSNTPMAMDKLSLWMRLTSMELILRDKEQRWVRGMVALLSKEAQVQAIYSEVGVHNKTIKAMAGVIQLIKAMGCVT